MPIQFSTTSRIVPRGARFLKRHYRFGLFLLFVGALLLWAYIFWEYGWRTVFSEPDVTVRAVSVRESEMRAVLDDARARVELQEQKAASDFPNPFGEPPSAL
jgi:hypothetical protein